MKIVLDTNRYSDLDRKVPGVSSIITNADEVHVPFVVLAELHIGFRRGTRQRENQEKLERFLSLPGVLIRFPDLHTVDLFASLTVQLLANGTPIPINDVWIATFCIQDNLTLFARDKHFDQLPQLVRI